MTESSAGTLQLRSFYTDLTSYFSVLFSLLYFKMVFGSSELFGIWSKVGYFQVIPEENYLKP